LPGGPNSVVDRVVGVRRVGGRRVGVGRVEPGFQGVAMTLPVHVTNSGYQSRHQSRHRLVEAIDLVTKLAQLQSGPVTGGGLSAMQKAQFAAREVAIAEFVAACDEYVKVWCADMTPTSWLAVTQNEALVGATYSHTEGKLTYEHTQTLPVETAEDSASQV
jgi:hypothetical protein